MDVLFQEIQRKCLEKAKSLIEKDAAPTTDEIGAAKGYMEIARTIEELNLQWAMQSRYASQVR